MVVLTDMQARVLQRLSEGLTTPQIAARLGTKRTNVQNALQSAAKAFGLPGVDRPALVSAYLVWRAEQ